MKTEREDDARAAVAAPEEESDAVFGSLRELHVPEQQLAIKRPALAPEGRAEQPAIWLVARSHKALQVMARDQFVMHGRAREVGVVATHAHHLLLVRHRVGWIGYLDHLAAQEERADQLSFGRHHLHPPRLASQWRHRDQIVLLDEVNRLIRQV